MGCGRMTRPLPYLYRLYPTQLKFPGGVPQKEAPLLVPDVLVCSVGTEIFFESTGEPDKGWQEVLDRGWDRAGAIAAAEAIPELQPQVCTGSLMTTMQRYPDPRLKI